MLEKPEAAGYYDLRRPGNPENQNSCTSPRKLTVPSINRNPKDSRAVAGSIVGRSELGTWRPREKSIPAIVNISK
jgi:hypothetical protein